MCYYIPLLDSTVRRTWWEARKFCQRHKGDLAVVDSIEKHVRYNITLFAKWDFFLSGEIFKKVTGLMLQWF